MIARRDGRKVEKEKQENGVRPFDPPFSRDVVPQFRRLRRVIQTVYAMSGGLEMPKMVHVMIPAVVLLTLTGCGDPELSAPSSSLLDPNGNFTLFVSNQSFEIDPVDVRVEIDGELVVSACFAVGTQHSFVPFVLSLSEGKHQIRIWSKKGDAELSTEFELEDHDVGVITYWYSPRRHYEPTPRHFNFRTQKGPLLID